MLESNSLMCKSYNKYNVVQILFLFVVIVIYYPSDKFASRNMRINLAKEVLQSNGYISRECM